MRIIIITQVPFEGLVLSFSDVKKKIGKREKDKNKDSGYDENA